MFGGKATLSNPGTGEDPVVGIFHQVIEVTVGDNPFRDCAAG